jgi:hypothetical protein
MLIPGAGLLRNERIRNVDGIFAVGCPNVSIVLDESKADCRCLFAIVKKWIQVLARLEN